MADKAKGNSAKPTPSKLLQTEAKPKTAPKPSKNWRRLTLKVLLLLIWVGVAVIASQLIVGYLMIWILGQETFAQPLPTAIFSALSYVVAMLLVIFIPPKISVAFKLVNENKHSKVKTINGKAAPKPADRKLLGLKGLPTWTDIGLAPVGFIVYLIIAAILTALFMLIPGFDAEQAQEVGFSSHLVGFDRILAFLTLVVIAPIAEEIIFRGWLYGKLRQNFSHQMSEITGIILSALLVSLLFGIVHLQWNVGVNVFAMSLVMCALREITGTIYAGILMHMIKNGVAFYVLFMM